MVIGWGTVPMQIRSFFSKAGKEKQGVPYPETLTENLYGR